MTSQTRIQTVSRAVRILLAVSSSDEGLTVKAVTEQFKLSTPTAYHLLNTLVEEGMLLKDDRRRYLLGPTASVIAEAYNRRNVIPERYLQGLQTLAAATGETAYLSGWRNGKITVLATVEGTGAVRVAGLSAGYSDNVHARASGKLLLAYASEDVRELVLSRSPLRKVTAHTITSRAALDREINQVRADGISFDREEFREGVSCASVPITEDGVVVACLTLATTADRFAAKGSDFVEQLRGAASAIAA